MTDAGSRLGPDAPRWKAFYDFDSEGPRTQENSWHVTNWSSTRDVMIDGLTEVEAIAVRDALNAVARGTVPGEPAAPLSDEKLLDAFVAACNRENELNEAELSPENVRRGVAAAMRSVLARGEASG